MTQAHLKGFIKRAAQYGLTEQQAYNIYKQAGRPGFEFSPPPGSPSTVTEALNNVNGGGRFSQPQSLMMGGAVGAGPINPSAQVPQRPNFPIAPPDSVGPNIGTPQNSIPSRYSPENPGIGGKSGPMQPMAGPPIPPDWSLQNDPMMQRPMPPQQAPAQIPPQIAQQQPMQPSQADLLRFRKTTASRFNPNSAGDVENMRRLLANPQAGLRGGSQLTLNSAQARAGAGHLAAAAGGGAKPGQLLAGQ